MQKIYLRYLWINYSENIYKKKKNLNEMIVQFFTRSFYISSSKETVVTR